MRRHRQGAILGLLLLLGAPAPAWTAAVPELPDETAEFSLSFLGTYRKVMEIEDEIARAAERYDVDLLLARALCLYESGGNDALRSSAGARGYLQVMPGTFRRMGVSSNIEAGIKYLSLQLGHFRREDLALAAYNAGPGAVERSRRVPLETVQYVLGIGNFKNILQRHEWQIRRLAEGVHLLRAEDGDTWWSMSRRTGVSVLVLRMYNPFLARRPMKAGRLIAYPATPHGAPVTLSDEAMGYITRPGDQYLFLAAVFGVSPDTIRRANGLWHVDLVLPGTPLSIPLVREEARWAEHRVRDAEDLGDIAEATSVPVWDLIRDNRLWDQDVSGVEVVRVDLSRKIPRYAPYRVQRGDTLEAIARRHSVGLDALRRANGFSPGHWRIQIGETLRIPLN